MRRGYKYTQRYKRDFEEVMGVMNHEGHSFNVEGRWLAANPVLRHKEWLTLSMNVNDVTSVLMVLRNTAVRCMLPKSIAWRIAIEAFERLDAL